jgi:hypothetical protein
MGDGPHHIPTSMKLAIAALPFNESFKANCFDF